MVMEDIKRIVEPYKNNIAWLMVIMCVGYSVWNLYCIINIHNEQLQNQIPHKDIYYVDLGAELDKYDYYNPVIEDKNHEVVYRMINMMYALFIGGMIYARNLTTD